jgi:hypothetical protein
MKPPPEPHYRHRFTAEIIGHAVGLYHVFSRSLRDVDLLLAERGIVVCYETVRRWCRKPSPQPNQRTGITDAQPSGLHPQQHLKAAELLACSSTPLPWRNSRDRRTGESVTSTLERGIICILRLQTKAA